MKKKNKTKPPLTAPVAVNVQRAGRPPLASSGLWRLGKSRRAAVSQAPCGSSISPQLAQSGLSSAGGPGGGAIDGVLYVCQFNTCRSNGAHIESCCVCIINMCVGVYVARRPTWK